MSIKTEQNTKGLLQLSSQPYKGARDFYPEDMRIRDYIFDTWRMVCKRYGFEEYDFPILEPYEIFAAKTGEEIVNEQMFNFTDRGGRRLAIRPELTPGTVRMIAQRFNKLQKPIKWFMIGDNWRAEKPQKGRGREFYQLEANIFGVNDVIADFEIFKLMIDILKAFGGDENKFVLYYNDRRIVSALLRDSLKLNPTQQIATRRLMDKSAKIARDKFLKDLKEIGLDSKQSSTIVGFLKASFDSLAKIIPAEIIKNNLGYKSLLKLRDLLVVNGLDKYCEYNPGIIRGFDYSDGVVYEVFDKNPENSRSIFGGERFDKLINIFGDFNLPATGFAMGDYTLLEFIKGWNLLPEFRNETKVMVTVFSPELAKRSQEITDKLRKDKINTLLYLEPDKLDKQLKYADRKGIPYAIIIGPDEIKKGTVILKDMKKKEQREVTVEEAIKLIATSL